MYPPKHFHKDCGGRLSMWMEKNSPETPFLHRDRDGLSPGSEAQSTAEVVQHRRCRQGQVWGVPPAPYPPHTPTASTGSPAAQGAEVRLPRPPGQGRDRAPWNSQALHPQGWFPGRPSSVRPRSRVFTCSKRSPHRQAQGSSRRSCESSRPKPRVWEFRRSGPAPTWPVSVAIG